LSPWIVVPAALAFVYAIAVVAAAWRAPDKGFQAFIGHRVIHVETGGVADLAGVHEGDVIVAVDGEPISGTFDYSARVLSRTPGEHVVLGVTRDGARRDIPLDLRASPPPWSALIAAVLAAVLLVLGLIARIGRPDEVVARRFYWTSVIYAIVYVGALSWARLIVHPVLGITFLLALFVGPRIAFDLGIELPTGGRAGATVRRWRRFASASAIVLGVACAIALAVAIADYTSGRGDRALPWISGTIALHIATIPLNSAIGLRHHLRAHREAHGAARAQLRWVLFGQALVAVPTLGAIPVAIADLDRFMIVGYQPFVVAIAILWFLAYGFAVLQVRLADVDALIKSSLGYALTTGAAAMVYLAVVLAAGWLTGELVGDAGPWPHLVAGVTAATMFGPLRARVGAWLDRRFFRDRHHYVEALRHAGESLALLREPADLARATVEQIVDAVRAESGALYLRGGEPAGWTIGHTVGGEFPPVPRAPDDGFALPVHVGDEPAAWLVLGPRRSGDLYSSQDRDLLGALASQLAVALGNAKAYGTIAEMSRTLETQNVEIRGLRDRLEDENRFLRARVEAATGGATLVGDSQAIRELTRTIEIVARSGSSVLVVGESGTGKGLVARMLHAASPRAEAPFMHVDCGAIAAGVFESELFGHERGAFTGASRERRGPIELADGGTLFLDEIGELPLDLQPKLLRVLEDREILRVGASQPIKVDVRIVAATHRKLDDMVARGEFREDLYFRLRVVDLVVPPLRARRADLPALCASLLPRVARRCGRPVRPVADDALARLAAYTWPGNVRELANVLERALVLGKGERIAAEDLDLPERAPTLEEFRASGDIPVSHDLVMEDIERRRLTAALRDADGNQSHAAKALGMPRTTFINKLRKHGLL
jgi:transcriptional regulator with GAF, ATPase, and Fis domain